MARDIEEFLRRAAERRKKQLKQKQAGQPPAQVPQPPPQRRKQRPATFVIADDQVEVVRKRKPEMREESVVDHVRRHMDTSDVTERASHLAENLELTDERTEARLKKRFDRDLGS